MVDPFIEESEHRGSSEHSATETSVMSIEQSVIEPRQQLSVIETGERQEEHRSPSLGDLTSAGAVLGDLQGESSVVGDRQVELSVVGDLQELSVVGDDRQGEWPTDW